jgi:hypothetical protein
MIGEKAADLIKAADRVPQQRHKAIGQSPRFAIANEQRAPYRE